MSNLTDETINSIQSICDELAQKTPTDKPLIHILAEEIIALREKLAQAGSGYAWCKKVIGDK